MDSITATVANGNGTHNGNHAREYSHTVTPEELATRHNLKPQVVKGELEWHGANFLEAGATKDGFVLKADGKAFDRNGRTYTSREVETGAGLARDEYEPCREYSQRNGATFNGNGNGAPQLPPAPKASPAPKAPPKPYDTRTFAERGIPPETLRAFSVTQRHSESVGAFVVYPTFHADGTRARDRVKYQDPARAGNKKNIWAKTGGEGIPTAYGLERVQPGDDVVLVNGEVSVWSCYEVGIRAVCTLGEGNDPAPLMKALAERGAASIRIVLDNDTPGRNGTANALREADATPISATAHQWPQDWKEGADASDLYEKCREDGRDFREALEALPLAQISEADAPEATSTREVKPAFELLTLRELEARPSPDWLIPDVITCGKTSLMTAKHASFKSFMTLGMGLCVAGGLPWYGRGVARGAVVYVAAEGASGITKRARAWCIENACEMPRDFHVIDKPAQIHNEATRRAFVETIAAVSPVLIILDTLARCAVGMDENSARDMGEFADALGQLAEETGAHVMTVHHNNKGGEYRGSSAVPAAVDTHLSLERDGRGDTVVLKCEKQKDAEEFHPMTFSKAVIDWNQGRDDSLVFRLEQSGGDAYGGLSNSDEKVLCELLEGYGETGATHSVWKRLCADAGIAERTATRSIYALHKKEYVACPDAGKRGAVYTPNAEKCARFSSQCQNGLAPTFEGDTDQIDTETAPSESKNAAFTSETAFSEFSAKVPMAPTGTDGTDQNAEGAKVPHSFRSGTNGTDGARKEVTPETAPALPEMPPPSARKKKNANADSEAYPAPEITPDESELF
jgi:hypothetical protein